ncbi:hypothetical protein BDN70DRAFT_880818 [Pholiota conissans]|uniref:Uncharacterized protein n=1 Tax=Pholiota conissans TaxID=109636 RepID=A0A9P5YXT4_9AGAR|nr:hypothetical protein BDN70DRAFT_880818 [Pholiota conissans]
MAYILRPKEFNSSPSGSDGDFQRVEVPQEIVDAIIDEIVDSADIKHCSVHLRACALVSRAFRHSAYRFLFSVYEISHCKWSRSYSTLTTLRELIEGNPNLVSYLRRLRIVADSRHPGNRDNQSRISTSYKNQKSKFIDLGDRLGLSKDGKLQKNLIWVLQTISAAQPNRLTTLEICGRERGLRMEYCASWKGFSKGVAATLINIAKTSAQLQAMKLCNIMDLPIALLTPQKGSSFSHLTLDDCTFLPTDSAPQSSLIYPFKIITAQPPLVQLQSLQSLNLNLPYFGRNNDLSGAPDLTVLPFPGFPKLEDLTLSMYGSQQDAVFLKWILTSYAPLLEELGIVMNTHSNTSPWDWDSLTSSSEVSNHDIIAIKQLSTRNQSQRLVNTGTDFRAMFQAAFTIFNYPMLPTTIQTIIIQILVEAGRFVVLYTADGTLLPEDDAITLEKFKAEMNSLDEILSDRLRYPKLEKLTVSILVIKGKIDGTWCADLLDSEGMNADAFPRLYSMGEFDITIDLYGA